MNQVPVFYYSGTMLIFVVGTNSIRPFPQMTSWTNAIRPYTLDVPQKLSENHFLLLKFHFISTTL